MIGLGHGSLRIYVALAPCDMRKSFNGLYDIVCQQFDNSRLSREVLFVFANKRRNRIKLLYFDGTGLWVAAKRLERGTFSWPKPKSARTEEAQAQRRSPPAHHRRRRSAWSKPSSVVRARRRLS